MCHGFMRIVAVFTPVSGIDQILTCLRLRPRASPEADTGAERRHASAPTAREARRSSRARGPRRRLNDCD